MRAIAFTRSLPASDPDALVDITLDTPQPGPRDLRVKVEAVSVNPVDVKVRAGGDQADPRVLGFDAAGIVDAVGSEVTLFKPGDAVFYAGSITRPGTNSEYHLVDERIVGRKPKTLDFAEAAAIPLTAITAYELLFDRIGVRKGAGSDTRSLLILGAAGGVGSIAIQLARTLTDLTVIGTASRTDSAEWARSLGAHHIVDHTKPMAPQLDALGFKTVDIILSLTGTTHNLPQLPELVAPKGHIGVIDDPKVFDIVPFKRKAVSLHWELMFTRPIFGLPDMIEQHTLLNEVADLVDAGKIRTTLTGKLGPINAANLRKAHEQVESGRMIGKVVLAGW
ncbi:zinc-binding alcohol dehydrogenase family protein [Kaistia dalseonensis]|uniref:Zinc-type alcohol dehydrogenase-like protein n=1 Tax=Kaistia dalseonensis TaxID=410840 RepID=A0ABU0HBV7_9HYPH|nr:zinc-binding alcohol dehydrogenase family protein [Kaistia dalseonensis]MCX5497161.1 zinc-binding alcohol dehydrogenase family protein [Kaistia dalseonensis]MDQ0439789.1 NADPH2:quinone reductase [Kaistia dalseonensis]